MAQMSEEHQSDSLQQSDKNKYILKAFNHRKRIAQEVIFGDSISASEKADELVSDQIYQNHQSSEINSDRKSEESPFHQNQQNRHLNSQNNLAANRVGSDLEKNSDDKLKQKREADKRLIQEQLQRKNKPQYLQHQSEQQSSNGLADLDINQKRYLKKEIPEEQIQVSNSQKKEQLFQEHKQGSGQMEVLKHKLQRLSIFNQGHIHPIIKVVSENNKIIEMTQKRFEDQNIILSQFKEETSRKLEENIKHTLKEKMNEMNRENAKELKDIKNMSLFIQELLQKYDSRMDKIEKNIDDILKNSQKK